MLSGQPRPLEDRGRRSFASGEGKPMTPSTLLARQQAQAAPDRPALVVDLDGTLVRTDTLIESVLAALTRPLPLLRPFPALPHGRAPSKQTPAPINAFAP